MRAGWNAELEKRLHRADPAARLIVDAIHQRAVSMKVTSVDHIDATTITGGTLVQIQPGGATPLGSALSLLAKTSGTPGTEITELGGTDVRCAAIEWTVASAEDHAIHEIDLPLIRQVDGGLAQEVDRWIVQLFRVAAIGDATPTTPSWVIEPISDPRTILESAFVGSPTAAELMTVDFTDTGGRLPVIGPPPVTEGDEATRPITVIVVRALSGPDGNGQMSEASNAGWESISDADGVSTEANGILRHISLYGLDLDESQTAPSLAGAKFAKRNVVSDVPAVAVRSYTYADVTADYTGTGAVTSDPNELDLGVAPVGSRLEVTAQGEEPRGSSLEFYLDDGVSGWVRVYDGDLVGVDNTATGGADLTGLTVQQSYDARVIFRAASSGVAAPIVRRFGIEDQDVSEFDGIATVEGTRWAVDPVSGKGEIGEATIRLMKHGANDYADPATELFFSSYPGDILLRAWIGAQDLDRRYWLHVDSWEVEDYEVKGPEIVVQGLSPLARARTMIPPINAGNRQVYRYTAQTLAAIYDDLIRSQIALPARYIGPGPTSTDTAGKKIEESDGKDELDAVAWLAGGAAVTSQGRIKWVDLFGDHAPVERFAPEDVAMGSLSAGLRERISEFIVPYGWAYDSETPQYDGEVRVYDGDALATLSNARLDPPERLEDSVTRWIETEALASTVGQRVVRTMGRGLRIWRFRSTYPMPHLEPGDAVTVVTDQFVGRDAARDVGIRGLVAAHAVVIGVGDPWGRDLTVWIPDLEEVVPTTQDVARLGYVAPRIYDADVRVSTAGVVSLRVRATGHQAVEVYAVKGRDLTDDDLTEVLANGRLYATTGSLEVPGLATLAEGQTISVAVVAWELSDGTGERSALTIVGGSAQATPTGPVPEIDWRAEVTGTDAVVKARVVSDPGELLATVEFWDGVSSIAAPTYVEDPTPNVDGDYVSTTYDLATLGDPLDVPVRMTWERGTGETLEYLRTVRAETNSAPEVLSAFAQLERGATPLHAVRVDTDTDLVRSVEQLTPFASKSAAATAALAGTDRTVSGGQTSWTTTTVVGRGQTLYGAVIPFGPDLGGGVREEGEVVLYEKHRAAVATGVLQERLDYASGNAGFTAVGNEPALMFAYRSSTSAMPSDDPTAGDVVIATGGSYTQLILGGPDARYVVTKGDVHTFDDDDSEVLYVRGWFFEDKDADGPAGPSVTLEIPAPNLTPKGRLYTKVDLDGTATVRIIGLYNARGAKYKLNVVDAEAFDDAEVIADDDTGATVVALPEVGGGAVNLEHQSQAEVTQALTDGQSLYVRVWLTSASDGSGVQTVEDFTDFVSYRRVTPATVSAKAQVGGTSAGAGPNYDRADVTLQIDRTVNLRKTAVRVWTNPTTDADGDPTSSPDGTYEIAAGGSQITTIGPSATFDLTGGGTGTLLYNIDAWNYDSGSAQILGPKRIFVEAIGYEGTGIGQEVSTSGVVAFEVGRGTINLIDLDAKLRDGVEAAGDVYVADTGAVKVGTALSPSVVTKTRHFGYADMSNKVDTDTASGGLWMELLAATNGYFSAPIDIAPGAEITGFRVIYDLSDILATGDLTGRKIDAELRKITQAGESTIASTTFDGANTAGWVTSSLVTASETVASDGTRYEVLVELTVTGSHDPADVKVLAVIVEYEIANLTTHTV